MAFTSLFNFAGKCFVSLAWPVFALIYPLCASIQAIETNSDSDTQKLIAYWISISLVLFFENAFELEWLTLWLYIKLMIVGFLVVPRFDGSLYVYQHLVRPCLSMGPRIITCQFHKLDELFNKDDFLDQAERFIKENGTDALENLVSSKKQVAKPNVAVDKIKEVAAENRPNLEEPKFPVPLKDSNAANAVTEPKLQVPFKVCNAVEITEPKLAVPFKGSNAVDISEKKVVTSIKQVRQVEPNICETENRTSSPLKNVVSAVADRDVFEIPPSQKIQKEWTCAICQVTTQSETVLTSHLRGRKHEAACERLRAKNDRTLIKSDIIVFPASVGMKSKVPTAIAGIGVRQPTGLSPSKNVQKAWTCVVCQVTLKSQIDIQAHLQGKRHKEAFHLASANNQASTPGSASAGRKSTFPENKPEKCKTRTSSCPLDGRRHEAQKNQFVEIRDSKWRCTICNVSCTSEGDMDSHIKGNRHVAVRNSKWCPICNISCSSEGNMECHLNGNKHLARMRELDGLGHA